MLTCVWQNVFFVLSTNKLVKYYFQFLLVNFTTFQNKASNRKRKSDTDIAFQIMVLKGVPSLLSPDLLHALASMGHGDKIVLADANFPSASICAGDESPRLVRADGHTIPQLLRAVLSLMPLDTYVFAPVISLE